MELDKEVKKILKEKHKELTENPISYYIGVDILDEKNMAYCLMRKQGENAEIMLANVRHDEKEFKQEVDNLAKYFNAVKIWEEKK